MKKVIITIILALSLIVFGDPNDVSVTYEKIDANTVTMTEVTTYIKSVLEAEKADLIRFRDSDWAIIEARYQPRIDAIDAKLEWFK